MSLFIDPRVGSGDLVDPLRRLGLPAELCALDFADVAFLGNGPEERPVPVGIEIKTLSDLLQSMQSGRLAGHQLPGLLAQYEHVWLIVEGSYRPAPSDGVLETETWRGSWKPHTLGRQGKLFMWRDVESFLLTLELKTGLRTRHTYDRHETARQVGAIYSWWVGKEWADHRSHLALHTPRDHGGVILAKPSLLRRVAATLPGVGFERSADVARSFKSVRELANAVESDWREIPGIGKKLASQIVKEITSNGPRPPAA